MSRDKRAIAVTNVTGQSYAKALNEVRRRWFKEGATALRLYLEAVRVTPVHVPGEALRCARCLIAEAACVCEPELLRAASAKPARSWRSE